MGRHLINFIVYIENVICVYRNFFVCNKFRKFFVLLRISFEIFLIAVHTVVRIGFYPYCFTDLFYFYLTCSNSVVVLILALYHSKGFKSLKCHLNYVYKSKVTIESYRKNVEAKRNVFIVLVCLVCMAQLGIFTWRQMNPIVLPSLPLIWHYLLELNLFMCDLRFMVECLMLYCVIYVISEQIQLITHNINMDALDKFEEIDKNTLNEVRRWSAGYKHIRLSCKLFNKIFGFQLTVMLSTTIIFYIIFLYRVASQSVAGSYTALDMVVYISYMFYLLSIFIMISRSAQQMQNSADVLRRRLCKLLILSLSNEENYKATRDLLRMMSSRPIRARAFGLVDIDMTLIPSCISFFTTYTVVALQFNNIL